ncbi:hypothetical protein E3J62_04170 [candidate division TA06 bacterium]|uniref:Uncharacterized protein n=1 Tax=candidate division TA06 bacterium TaxID=2250710 RepID=A0A523UV87_UNCT6|nr:MAG: hypothetical protein E3J62_04170 [candidate division TA06 bacterium]
MKKFLPYLIIGVCVVPVGLVGAWIWKAFELTGINFLILWLSGVAVISAVAYLATRSTRRSSRQ